jgi:hypothetical protein
LRPILPSETLVPEKREEGMTMRLLRPLVPTEAFTFDKRSDDPITHLQAAQKLFGKRDNASALASLEKFKTQVKKNQGGKSLSARQAEVLLGQVQHILTCVKPWNH